MGAMLLGHHYSHHSIDELRTTLAKVTPGPWTLGGLKVYQGSGHGAKQLLCLSPKNENNLDLVFACKARQDIPILIGRIDSLTGQLETAKRENAALHGAVESLNAAVQALNEREQKRWWPRLLKWFRRTR